MNFSKTTEYAMRVLSHMAIKDKELYSAQYLHETLSIPQKYLRKLLTNLSKKGLINSSKGRNGGFSFSKDINDIYIIDIIEAVEGFEVFQPCFFGFEKCFLDKKCVMHSKWAKLRKSLKEIFSETSLGDFKKATIGNIKKIK